MTAAEPDALRLVPDDVIVRGLKLMADHFRIETPLQREFNVRGWPNMSAKTSEALSECATMAAERLSMLAASPAVHPPAQASESGGERWSFLKARVDTLVNILAPDQGETLTEDGRRLFAIASAIQSDRAALSAPQAAPGEGEQS